MNKNIIHKNLVLHLNRMFVKKNDHYGDSFAKQGKRYPQAVLIRLSDKVNRLETLLEGTEQNRDLDESIEDTLFDIAGYAIMEIMARLIDRDCASVLDYEDLVQDSYKFDDYAALAMRTANPRLTPDQRLANVGLGLTGEAGEVADTIKKHLHQGHSLDRESIVKELGDVLWYVAEGADYLNIPMAEIAKRNVDKLKARYPAGFDTTKSQERME